MSKTEDGIRVLPDHGDELAADVVLFATGKIYLSQIFVNISISCVSYGWTSHRGFSSSFPRHMLILYVVKSEDKVMLISICFITSFISWILNNILTCGCLDISVRILNQSSWGFLIKVLEETLLFIISCMIMKCLSIVWPTIFQSVFFFF